MTGFESLQAYHLFKDLAAGLDLASQITEILPFVKIPHVADPHPLKVDPRIGLLCTLEGFGLVGGIPFPDQ